MNRPLSGFAFPLRIRSVVAFVVVASASLWAPLASPAAAAVGALQLVAPVTDNYKTWSEDRNQNGPGHTDNRTSLLFTGIVANGQTYVVPQSVRDAHGSPDGAAREWHEQGGIPLAKTVGGPVEARLTFNHDGANAWSYFRLWPDGVFGPLMTINRPAFVAEPHTPVAGTFEVKSTADGSVLANRIMSYRYDAGIAALPLESVEWHGPLGRWHLGSDATAPTPLNWPAGTAVSDTPAGPHDAQIAVPAGQASTLYVAPVDIAGLAVPRVPEEISLAWSPAGAGRPTSAAGVQAWRPISVTLPTGTYDLDATGTCQEACRFDYEPLALTACEQRGRGVERRDVPTGRGDPRRGWGVDGYRYLSPRRSERQLVDPARVEPGLRREGHQQTAPPPTRSAWPTRAPARTPHSSTRGATTASTSPRRCTTTAGSSCRGSRWAPPAPFS